MMQSLVEPLEEYRPGSMIAIRWIGDYYGLANREWSDKTTEKEIYEQWDYTVAGGEQDIRPNPRIKLIRELVKEIRVSERNVIGVTLNV